MNATTLAPARTDAELHVGDLRLVLRPDLGGCIAGLWRSGEPVLRSTEPAALQSVHDAAVFIAGDAAALPVPLEKQAYHAQDTGRHAALNAARLLAGKTLRDFRPLQRPALVSFGDRDAFLFYGRQALATPALLALKEGIYQYGYHQLLPPRSGRDLAGLARDLRHGMATLDMWRTLAASGDASLFHAR